MRKDGSGAVVLTDLVAGAIRLRNEKIEVLAPATNDPRFSSLAVAPNEKAKSGSAL